MAVDSSLVNFLFTSFHADSWQCVSVQCVLSSQKEELPLMYLLSSPWSKLARCLIVPVPGAGLLAELLPQECLHRFISSQ